MANELKIRQAQLADAFAISTIGTKAFCQAFINPKNEAEVREYVKTVYQTAAIETDLQRKKDYFVIEDNSEILGFSLLSHDPPYPDCSEKYVKVERLYIEPNRIGQGLGLALMNHAVLYGQNNNFDKIWLEVLITNHSAIKFYLKFGLKQFDTNPGKFEADQEIDLWLQKILPPKK